MGRWAPRVALACSQAVGASPAWAWARVPTPGAIRVRLVGAAGRGWRPRLRARLEGVAFLSAMRSETEGKVVVSIGGVHLSSLVTPLQPLIRQGRVCDITKRSSTVVAHARP